jgi:periplasmic protein TonB
MDDLGNLSHCMVDGDPEVSARARRLRRKAVVISICMEAVCLAALLIWPLLTPGVLTGPYTVTPLPPYHGGAGGSPARTQHQPHASAHRPQMVTGFVFHPQQPLHAVRQVTEESAPDLGPNLGNTLGWGSTGDGLVVPGAPDRGVRIEPPRETPSVQPTIRKKVSEGVMAGALLHRVDPAYPQIARAMRLSGEVRLRAIIATDGSVQHLEILSGSPILARAAADAVRQWRYHPTLLSGMPVEVDTYITVNFVLGH